MDLIQKIHDVYLSTPFDGKEKIIRGEVYNECAILSARLKWVLSKILNKENIRIIDRDGYGDHRSLRVFKENPKNCNYTDKGITIDPTIAQFIPSMRGQLFIGDDTQLITLLDENVIVDPHTGQLSQASKKDLFKALYGEVNNMHSHYFN